MQDISYLTEQLDNEINKISEQIVDCQKTALELQEQFQRLVAKREFVLLNEEIYARNMKTRFTKKELKEKFKMGDETFNNIKKIGRLKPVDSLGRAKVYDLSQFEQAKEDYRLWKSR